MFDCQKDRVYMTKESCLYVERDGSTSWKSRIIQLFAQQSVAISTLSKEPCLYVKRAVSYMSKETRLHTWRAVFIWQKSRVYMTKETCLHVIRDGSISRNRRIVQLSIQQSLTISTLSKEPCLYDKRDMSYMSKETCLYVYRAVFIWQKSHVYMSKETCII